MMTEFEKLVEAMRWNQTQYFKSREGRFLAESKQLEKMVDEHLRRVKEAERQPTLFGGAA